MTDPLDLPDQPPADVVPRRGLTLDTLRRLNAAVGQPVTVTQPGEVLLDPDGIPVGVGPTTTTKATMVSPVFFLSEVEALGGNPADYPHITFI